MNFKVLVKRAIYEPTITLMFIAYWRHQKIDRFLFLLKLISSAYLKKNAQSFCVKSYLGTSNHVHACCLMTSSEQKYFFFLLLIHFIT